MQKDEIWELKPEKNDEVESSAGGGETDRPKDEAPGAEKPAEPAAPPAGQAPEAAEQKPRKEPDRLDMDEILDLKPEEEKPAEAPTAEKPAQETAPETKPAGEADKLELVDIGEKKPAVEEEEGVVVARKEEKSISIEKPQVLEPEEGSKRKGKPAELQTGEFKKFERAPRVQGGTALPQASGLITIGLVAAFVFLAASTAILALPFFGIETLPEDLPVVGHLIDFYRGLPIFPD